MNSGGHPKAGPTSPSPTAAGTMPTRWPCTLAIRPVPIPESWTPAEHGRWAQKRPTALACSTSPAMSASGFGISSSAPMPQGIRQKFGAGIGTPRLSRLPWTTTACHPPPRSNARSGSDSASRGTRHRFPSRDRFRWPPRWGALCRSRSMPRTNRPPTA